jgi:hypothetical protein
MQIKNFEMVKNLLLWKADINFSTNKGGSVFLNAVEEESVEKIKFLLTIETLNFSKKDMNDENCLTLGVKNLQCFSILLNHMIDNNLFNESQWSKYLLNKSLKEGNLIQICSS